MPASTTAHFFGDSLNCSLKKELQGGHHRREPLNWCAQFPDAWHAGPVAKDIAGNFCSVPEQSHTFNYTGHVVSVANGSMNGNPAPPCTSNSKPFQISMTFTEQAGGTDQSVWTYLSYGVHKIAAAPTANIPTKMPMTMAISMTTPFA